METGTEVHFSVTNMGKKALGFGAKGVGLALFWKHQANVSALTATALDKGLSFEPGNEAECQDILVDVRQETSTTATLPASPSSGSV